MDIKVSFEQSITSPDIARIVWKMVFDDVLCQLRRNVEPWHSLNVELCGCQTLLSYPAYVNHEFWWTEPKYKGPWWDGNDNEGHHTQDCCELPGYPTCQMCDECYADWQYYYNKE